MYSLIPLIAHVPPRARTHTHAHAHIFLSATCRSPEAILSVCPRARATRCSRWCALNWTAATPLQWLAGTRGYWLRIYIYIYWNELNEQKVLYLHRVVCVCVCVWPLPCMLTSSAAVCNACLKLRRICVGRHRSASVASRMRPQQTMHRGPHRHALRVPHRRRFPERETQRCTHRGSVPGADHIRSDQA